MRNAYLLESLASSCNARLDIWFAALQAELNVFRDYRKHDLVIRVLKYKPDFAPYLGYLVARIEALHQHLPFLGQQ